MTRRPQDVVRVAEGGIVNSWVSKLAMRTAGESKTHIMAHKRKARKI
jgi:hypothetical protein